MDYLGKGEVFTNTDLDRFVNNIWEKYAFCVHRKSLRSLSSAHEKWGKKLKCSVYNFVQYKNKIFDQIVQSHQYSKPVFFFLLIMFAIFSK